MPLKGKKSLFKEMDALQEKNESKIKAVAIAMFTGVIAGTPVDTGRARANWFLTEGAPSSRRTRRTGRDPFKQLGKLKDTEVMNKNWFLTNNLPYVEGLEYEGRSRQAPLGWVRRTIKRVRIQIKRGRL